GIRDFHVTGVQTCALPILMNWGAYTELASTLGRTQSLVALSMGVLALFASTFHIGRPQYAFRAFIGLRTSWMSREIIAFGAFVKIGRASCRERGDVSTLAG